LEPFRNQISVSVRQPGEVATGAGESLDKSRSDWIGFTQEYDGDRVRGLLGSGSAAGWHRNEDIDIETDEFRGQRGQPLEPTSRVSLLDDGVGTFQVP
jgi:hypothetical protein